MDTSLPAIAKICFKLLFDVWISKSEEENFKDGLIFVSLSSRLEEPTWHEISRYIVKRKAFKFRYTKSKITSKIVRFLFNSQNDSKKFWEYSSTNNWWRFDCISHSFVQQSKKQKIVSIYNWSEKGESKESKFLYLVVFNDNFMFKIIFNAF